MDDEIIHESDIVTLGLRSEVMFTRKMKNAAWRITNAVIFPLTLRSHGIRRLLLKAFGARIAVTVRISSRCRIEYPDNLVIGANSSIGHNCYLQGLDRIVIGQNVCISDSASVLTGSHDLSSPGFALYTRPVQLEDGVWLAFGATVLPGVTMGRGAVAGAGAVVSRSVGAWTVLVGNPARQVGKRSIQS